MAATAKTTPQDLPPKGGYAPYPTERIRLRNLLSGRGTIATYIVVTVGASYLYFLNYKQVKREEVEARSARLAIWPMLIAERDREYLKQLNRNRREEAELMKNVPGWVVGTYYGEPIYKTLPKDKLLEPEFHEYYAHADISEFTKRAFLKMWS